ncbi:MAG: PAS domain-containing protein [Synechocystis sp.]
MPVFIAYLDPQLRYQFVNRTYENRLQKPSQEICGQSIEFVLGQDLYQQLLPKLRQAQQGQTVTYQAVIEQSAPTQIFVRANLIPDLNSNGELRGIFLLAIELGTDGTPQLSF